jgi:hypothetical protein
MTSMLRVPLLLALAAGLAGTGWLLMSTNFMIHDDEGYVLIGIRDFVTGRRLYDEVFTQYGPAPFLYYEAWHRVLGGPVTNLFGRALTLLHWLGAAVAAGVVAWRLSRRFWTAPFTTAAVFGYLWQMTWEPPHPGGLIAFVAALALAGAVEAVLRNRPALALGILGAAGAVLALTKINVGVFWLCGAGAWLLIGTARTGAGLAAIGLALLPFALMRPLLHEDWVLKFAVVFAVCSLAACALVARGDRPALGRREWLAGAAGFAGLGAVILGAILLHGTSLSGLLDGVILNPLRHPANFHFGFPWSAPAWLLLCLSLGLTGLWLWRPALRGRLSDIVAGLRVAGLGALAWHAEDWLSVQGPGHMVSLILPLTLLFLLPLGPEAAGNRQQHAAGLVALVGLGQVLHAYPVAGTQLGWGTFLLLPLCAAGLSEALERLARRLQRRWLAPAGAAAALLVVGWQTALLSQQAWQRWRHSDELGLPGAETVRPPENVRYALRILWANAQLHSDVLFSRPGMFSFNLWTGLPTPTTRNATHWFWLLSPDQQQEIVERLRAAPRPAVISSRPLIEFLDEKIGLKITGVLNDFITAHYRALFTVSGYDFLVPKDSPAAPFFVAQNFTRSAAAGETEPGLVVVNLAAQATVHRIVLRAVLHPASVQAEWDATNSRVTLARINSAGQIAGEPQPAAWPLQIEGLRQLRLYHRLPVPAGRSGLQLVFLDAAGRPLFEACYDEPVSVSLPPAGG